MTEYTASAWKARHTDRRICKDCMKKGHWTCATCHFSFPPMEFSAWQRHRLSGQNGTQECNRCIQCHTVRRAAARARKRVEARRRTTRQRAIMEQVRNGETTTMRTDTSHLPNPACQGLPRWSPSVCSFHMPKRLNALNSMKKNVAMDTNIWPWAYAVAQNVQRND